MLVKATLPLGAVELSLGLGPEFVFGIGAGVDIEYHLNLTPAQKLEADAKIKARYDAEKSDGKFLDVDLGLNIKVWKLIIPISLRVGINMDQPADYDGRVTLNLAGKNARVKAIESYHFVFMAGVGYVF